MITSAGPDQEHKVQGDNRKTVGQNKLQGQLITAKLSTTTKNYAWVVRPNQGGHDRILQCRGCPCFRLSVLGVTASHLGVPGLSLVPPVRAGRRHDRILQCQGCPSFRLSSSVGMLETIICILFFMCSCELLVKPLRLTSEAKHLQGLCHAARPP